MSINNVQSPTLYLSGSGVVVGATSATLTSLTDIYGNILTMTDFGTQGFITFEPDSSNEESATFTGITVNPGGTYTLTGLKTSLAKDPYTETSGLIRSHSGGTQVVITDTAAFWNLHPKKGNNETISGQWTFTNTPIVPGTVSDASTSVKGVSKLSVAPAVANNPIAYGANEPAIAFIPTTGQKDALVGSQGVPSTTNPYESKDNVYTAETDVSQATQDSTVEVGMANATTKKDFLAQSFIPTKTKIRGVKLYKAADTGTFTGTVTVGLYADSAGSPTGAALASVTITNVTYLATAVGEFEAVFTTEYSMTVGTLYWIHISCSTTDNSNHPNLGMISASAYASGSVKYWNTTDGWTAIANIDLYFKTLQGKNSQVVQTDTAGAIPLTMFDISKMPMPFIPQRIPIEIDATVVDNLSFTTNNDGSIGIITYQQSTTLNIWRVVRDTKTLNYYITHTTTITSLDAYSYGGTVIVGNYVYVSWYDSPTIKMKRYDLVDLANATDMTISGTGYYANSFTDGTNIYIYRTTNIFVKFTISGTTITNAGDVTYTGAGVVLISVGDNSGYVYMSSDADGSGDLTLKKYPITGGASISSTVLKVKTDAFEDANQVNTIFKAQTDMIGFMTIEGVYNASARGGTLMNLLFAISKP